MKAGKFSKGFGIFTTTPNLKVQQFIGAAQELGAERARTLSKLYRFISSDKTHAPDAIKKMLEKLQIKFPCKIVYFNDREAERYEASDQTAFLDILKKGPSLNMHNYDIKYQLTIIEN